MTQIGCQVGFSLGDARDLVDLMPPEATHLFWAERGLTPAAWVDLLQGLSVAGSGTPTVGGDATYWNGRNVAHTEITGSKGWRATGLAGLPVTGSRPYELTLSRLVTVGGSGNQTVTALGRTGTGAATYYWLRHNAVTGKLEASAPNTTGIVTGAPNAGLLPHIVELWCDGSQSHERIDGVDLSSANTAALAGDANYLAWGSTSTAANLSNSQHAVRLLCSSKPDERYIAAIVEYLESFYGL